MLIAIIVIMALIFMNVHKSNTNVSDISKVRVNEVNKVFTNITSIGANTDEDSANENNSA